jgi:hypothetical protein
LTFDINPIICHRWQIAASILDTGGNLLPVSTTPAVLLEKFAAGAIDTGGNFPPV